MPITMWVTSVTACVFGLASILIESCNILHTMPHSMPHSMSQTCLQELTIICSARKLRVGMYQELVCIITKNEGLVLLLCGYLSFNFEMLQTIVCDC